MSGRGPSWRTACRRAAPAAPAPMPRLDWAGLLSKRAQVVWADMRRAGRTRSVARPSAGLISFAGGMPDSTLFPTDAFRRVLNAVIRAEGRELLQYYAPAGYPPLRQYLASYLLRFGVEARPEEILIVNGSQQGFDLVARTLLDPGDFVAIERPSYPRAMQVFRSFGAELLAVPMDADGLDVGQLERLLERQQPKFLYCQPSAHNPTGLTMGLPARQRLLDAGRPPPAAHRGGRLRRHALLRRAAARAAEGARHGGPRGLSRHLLQDPVPGIATGLDRRAARAGGAARDGQAARRHPHEPAHPGRRLPLLPAASARPPPGAGAQGVRAAARRAAREPAPRSCRRASPGRRPAAASRCCSRCPRAWTPPRCCRGRSRRGVTFTPGSAFFVDGGGARALRLSFSAVPVAQIEEGVRRLAESVREHVRQAGGRPAREPELAVPLV